MMTVAAPATGFTHPGTIQPVRTDSLAVQIRARAPAGWHDPQISDHPANTPAFARVYTGLRTRPIFVEALAAGQVIARWLMLHARSWRPGRRGTVFSFCGPQMRPGSHESRDEVFVACIDAVRRCYRPANIQVANYSLVRDVSETALRHAGFRDIAATSCYVNDLTDDDGLLACFHRNHRTNTRQAIRSGYEFADDIPPREFLALARPMYAAQGLTAPPAWLIERIHRHLVRRSSALCSGVRVNGELKAASLILYSGSAGYYLHGASSVDKDRRAATFLHFCNMRCLRDRGVLQYDIGGARLTGDRCGKATSLDEFKRKFGGQCTIHWCGSER